MLETCSLQQKPSTYFGRPDNTSACVVALSGCFLKQMGEWKKRLTDSYLQKVFSPQAYALKMQDCQSEYIKLAI